MYSSQSSYQRPMGQSFSSPLVSIVQEAYDCEWCQKALTSAREYANPIKLMQESASLSASLAPCSTYTAAIAGYASMPSLLGYGASRNYFSSSQEPTANPQVTITYESLPSLFLNPQRREVAMAENDTQVLELAKETFFELTATQLPQNISITLCTPDELRQFHLGKWSDGIQGFAIPSADNDGLKRVFVKRAPIDIVMATLGHEIGHVITPQRAIIQDEEAKAFAFSEAWMRCMKRHNIGNLSACIADEPQFMPAQNGIHDVAFSFVRNLVKKGIEPLPLHIDMAKGYRSVFSSYN